MRKKIIRIINNSKVAWFALFLAGVSLHFAVEKWYKALAIIVGALLLDVFADAVLLKIEKDEKEVD